MRKTTIAFAVVAITFIVISEASAFGWLSARRAARSCGWSGTAYQATQQVDQVSQPVSDQVIQSVSLKTPVEASLEQRVGRVVEMLKETIDIQIELLDMQEADDEVGEGYGDD